MMDVKKQWPKYLLCALIIVILFSCSRSANNQAKAPSDKPLKKQETAPKSQEKGNVGTFLYQIVLLGGVGYIICLLRKPKEKRPGKISPDELKIENQKVKSQNEGLQKMVEIQAAEKARLLDELKGKETLIISMLENEKFMSKSFSEFKKHLDKLESEKAHLAKQLSDKEKELVEPPRPAAVKKVRPPKIL